MKLELMTGILVASLCVCAAETAANAALKTKFDSKKFARMQERANGGFLLKPGSGMGYVALVNQSGFDPSVCSEVAEKLKREWRIDVRVVGTGGNLAEKPYATAVLSDEFGPMVSLNLDTCTATVSIPALKAGADEKLLRQRVKKALSRAIGFAIGSGYSQEHLSVMAPIADLAALDKAEDSRLPIENGIQAGYRYGLKMYVAATYRDAVQEGWAPAPTNKYQKAIWDKVQAIPDKPLKITYDKAAQKPVVK